MIAQDRTLVVIDTQLHHLHVTVETTTAMAILATVIIITIIIASLIAGDIIATVVTTTDLSVTVITVIGILIVFLVTTFMVALIDQQDWRLGACLLRDTTDSYRFIMAQAFHI